VEDRTFYVLSYLAFCLAMLIPIAWFLYRANRRK
jgi:hypothetical protein